MQAFRDIKSVRRSSKSSTQLGNEIRHHPKESMPPASPYIKYSSPIYFCASSVATAGTDTFAGLVSDFIFCRIDHHLSYPDPPVKPPHCHKNQSRPSDSMSILRTSQSLYDHKDTINGFDMKFDSSASDGIRVIWAFTMALLQVSIEKDGNHPGIIIFDEPLQQSIVPEDMKSFIESVLEIKNSFQIITAITLNSQELIDIINGLDVSSYHKTLIEGKAFRAL